MRSADEAELEQLTDAVDHESDPGDGVLERHVERWDKMAVSREVDAWQTIDPSAHVRLILVLRFASIVVIVSGVFLEGQFVACVRSPILGNTSLIVWSIALLTLLLIITALIGVFTAKTSSAFEVITVISGLAELVLAMLSVVLLRMSKEDMMRDWEITPYSQKLVLAESVGVTLQHSMSESYGMSSGDALVAGERVAHSSFQIAQLIGRVSLVVVIVQFIFTPAAIMLQLYNEKAVRADPAHLQLLEFNPETRIQRIYDALREGGLI